MYQQITIKTLKNQGEKNTSIADQMGCHRNTVFNVLRRDKVIGKITRDKPSYFDNFQTKIKELLDKKVTRLRIYEILCEEYSLQRTYDSLCKYIQKRFPKKKEVFGVQIVEVGDEAEVDFGYVGLQLDRSGKLRKAHGFAMILSYSRNTYYEVVFDQKLETFIRACKNGFKFFKGVPKRLKVDNLRAAILKNQRYDLQFNQDFLEFANHYNFVIKPCQPHHPNEKGKVESAIKYLQINFFNGREFSDGIDLETRLYDWMVNYANKRTHGTTKRIPAKVFEHEERPELQSLPENEFSFFNRSVRKVKINCHINFESNYYSVPSRLVSKVVTIRWNKHILRIIYQDIQVAVHRITSNQGQYITVRNHLPEHKCYSQTEYQKRYELKMAAIGEFALEYFHQILVKQDSYWFRSIRRILKLKKEYGDERVNLSLKRALAYNVTDVAVIRNICKKNLYSLSLEPNLLQNHHNSSNQLLSKTTQLLDQDGNDSQNLTRNLNYYNRAIT